MNWDITIVLSLVSAMFAILVLKHVFDGMADKIDKEVDERMEKYLEEEKMYIKSTDLYITEYLRRCGRDANGRRIK